MLGFGAVAEFAIAEASLTVVIPDGVVIIDSDLVLVEVGPAIGEGGIGEEGPIAAFQRATQIMLLVPLDRAAGGAAIGDTAEAIYLSAGLDEPIARPRNMKKLVIAS